MGRGKPLGQSATRYCGPHLIAELRMAWRSAHLHVRHEDVSRERSWRDHHKHHTIIINLKCAIYAFEAELDDGTRSLQQPTAGYMSIVPAGRTFAGRVTGLNNRYAVWTISVDSVAGIAQEAGIAGPIEIVPRLSHRDETIYDAIRHLIAANGSADNINELRSDTINRRVALHLAMTYDARRVRLPPRVKRQILTRKAVNGLQDHINAHLADKITLADLAAVAGESVHDLVLGFRQRFGMTPHRYIVGQRLRRARWQLTHTSKPISQVAYDAGFSSQSHMTSVFARHVGMPPRAFRKAAC